MLIIIYFECASFDFNLNMIIYKNNNKNNLCIINIVKLISVRIRWWIKII